MTQTTRQQTIVQDGHGVTDTLDLDAKDAHGNTALHWASFYGKFRLVKLLLLYGATADVRNDRGKTPKEESCRGLPGTRTSRVTHQVI